MIRCPKCRFVQEEGAECARCGIVFAKFEARRLAVEQDDDLGVVTDTHSTLSPVSGPDPEDDTPTIRRRKGGSSDGVESSPERWGRRLRGLLLLLLLPVAAGVAVLSVTTTKLHRTEAHAVLTEFLLANERLALEIGEPSLRWWILGRIDADHETGTAVFVVPVSGPEGIGRVGATLVRAYGRWEVASAGFLWPSGREVLLAGNGWGGGDRVPPCPRDIAAFRFTARELLLRGESFVPGSGVFRDAPEEGATPAVALEEAPTPDRRPIYRRLSPDEVRKLMPGAEMKLGDPPPLWREQQLLTESQEAAWLENAPLRPVDLMLRRATAKVGSTRAVGYLAAAWLNERAGYEEAAVEWIEGGTPLVMYFRADWCPECLEFERQTLKAPRVREALDRMVKVRVNPETDERSRRLADAWRVEGYPTFFVLPVGREEPVRVATHVRDPGGPLSFPSWEALPPDTFLDRLKEAVNER